MQHAPYESLGAVNRTASRGRRWLPWLVGLPLLGFQLMMPLRYYLAEGSRDERFAWRMFSVHHRAECTVDAFEETRRGYLPYDPEDEVDGAWLDDSATIDRAAVAVAETRCQRFDDIRSVVLVTQCVAVNGRRESARSYRHRCESSSAATARWTRR